MKRQKFEIHLKLTKCWPCCFIHIYHLINFSAMVYFAFYKTLKINYNILCSLIAIFKISPVKRTCRINLPIMIHLSTKVIKLGLCHKLWIWSFEFFRAQLRSLKIQWNNNSLISSFQHFFSLYPFITKITANVHKSLKYHFTKCSFFSKLVYEFL